MQKYIIITLLLLLSLSIAQNIGGDGEPNPDWLINSPGFKSEIKIDKRKLELTNGLISRSILLEPNAATISLKHEITNEEFVRSVRPEAQIEVDGMSFNIGGLTGQPVHNYLLPRWLDEMQADPASFKFVGYETGPTKERFAWKKRLEWMPQDLPWPPPGKTLTLKFRADDQSIRSLLMQTANDTERRLLLEDHFSELSENWTVYASPGHPRNSFINEGKPGEIMALAHHAVFAEQRWPAEGTTAICRIDPGTDNSMAWGPGLALVFDNQIVKFNLRPAEKRFCIYDGEQEQFINKMQPGRTVWLKMRVGHDLLDCSFAYKKDQWIKAGSVEIRAGSKPRTVRLGKTDWSGGFNDHESNGERIRCRMEYFTIHGGLKDGAKSQDALKMDYLKDIEIDVHYNIYNGIPLISKWMTIRNNSQKTIKINSFKNEILAVVELQSTVGDLARVRLPNMTVETDYTFGGGMSAASSLGKSVFWNIDPLYSTQVNYQRLTPCLLECHPQYGPDQELIPGEILETFRVFELLHDSWERERKGLAVRRMYRTIAPWVSENPILMHVRQADDTSVKRAIDQCTEVGFEMVVLTFGSGFNMEDESAGNLDRLTKLADYAHAKGVALGGYSLLASRRVGGGNDVVMPEGQQPRFGNSPCLESEWGQDYFRKLYQFFKKTGMDILEHDGSYPGDICMSSEHPGHNGLDDSQWNQFVKIRNFYRWCRAKGIYLNVPDWYFLNGSSKTGMGYRETNWSLPRKQQEIIERQNVYDGTWEKTPSMGWMFVPLTQYHGGGAAATIEPLKDHLPHYEQRLANLFGAGVQACYRGPRLYDTDETKTVVKKWVDFYKKYRPILDSDIIHVRRADGRDLDCILHVNPVLPIKGLAMVYNPTGQHIQKKITLPLYYTGITDSASIAEKDGQAKKFKLSRDYSVQLPVDVPAYGVTWFVIK